MQFDLSPRIARYPLVRDRNPVRVASPWRRRLVLYGSGLAISLGLIWWGTSQVGAVSASSLSQGAAVVYQHERTLIAAAAAGVLDAPALVTQGMTALDAQHLEVAGIFLGAAAARDPKLRDAAVYAGYAQLALADGLWTHDPALAARRTRSATTYLEAARAIDPIHAYTFELLEIAYTNLGKDELASEAGEKAKLFALN